MIICDVRLLRRLEAERACAYASIGQVDADRILEEIEELRESRGELTMYSGPTIAKAFGIGLRTLTGRCVEGGPEAPSFRATFRVLTLAWVGRWSPQTGFPPAV